MERESQRMEEQEENPTVPDTVDQRATLGDLRMTKKGHVGTVRTGAAVVGEKT